MFSSFSLLPFQIGLPRFLQGGVRAGTGVDIKPVEIHHIEIKSDKRARSLKQLLKLNHVNYSIVYHNLSFHNHMPHVCRMFLSDKFWHLIFWSRSWGRLIFSVLVQIT